MIELPEAVTIARQLDGELRGKRIVDATAGNSAAQEIYKIIEHNWFHKNPSDTEALQKFGKLANVNGILFGRVSCIERLRGLKGREITYRFVWELANTETGVVDLAEEKKIRKNVR